MTQQYVRAYPQSMDRVFRAALEVARSDQQRLEAIDEASGLLRFRTSTGWLDWALSGSEGFHVTMFVHDGGTGRTTVEITAEPRRRKWGTSEAAKKLLSVRAS